MTLSTPYQERPPFPSSLAANFAEAPKDEVQTANTLVDYPGTGSKLGHSRLQNQKAKFVRPNLRTVCREGTIWSSIANEQELVHGAILGL